MRANDNGNFFKLYKKTFCSSLPLLDEITLHLSGLKMNVETKHVGKLKKKNEFFSSVTEVHLVN